MLKFFNFRQYKLGQALTALEAYDIRPAIRQRLLEFFSQGDSRELYHANPRLIAARLQLDERETLRLLVFALKEGLVTLHWDVQCPACLGINTNAKKLRELSSFQVCSCCQHRCATDADEQVRVTFSIDKRLRSLPAKANDPDFRTRIDAEYGVVSGHRLLTLQVFRDLFPRETIPPNESLVIRRVAILFTDLTGSTALYARRGDSQAYNLVRQHFNALFEVVDRRNGAVVKTIGDAIMAAFTIPADALQAAVDMHQALAALNQRLQLPPEDQLILKVGIDAGPCIVVNLNDRSDYFGTTVNTAARVQGTSKGKDIACTEALLGDSQAAAIAANYPAQINNFLLKGLDAPIAVHHLHIGNAAQLKDA